MKKFLCFFSVFSLTVCMLLASPQAQITAEADVANPEYWKNQALNDLIPFWENTIDRDQGGFYTDVEENGSVWGPGKNIQE